MLQRIQVLEGHLKKVPEDARGRTLLASDYAKLGRVEDAMREANLAMALRPDESMVMYNVACVFCQLGRKPEGLDALRKAWQAGFGIRAGHAAIPHSPSCTTTPSSRGCIQRVQIRRISQSPGLGAVWS